MERVEDIFGIPWDVAEARETQHGFAVLLGNRSRVRQGYTCKLNRVILTRELADYLMGHRDATIAGLGLPINEYSIRKVRQILGLGIIRRRRGNRPSDLKRSAWWNERIKDLANLKAREFAAKHGIGIDCVYRAHRAFIGPRGKPHGWYRTPAILARLTSGDLASKVAEDLGLTPLKVNKLRHLLRKQGIHVATDARELNSKARRGRPMHPVTREALRRAASLPKSLEQRRNMSEAQKKRWADKRLEQKET